MSPLGCTITAFTADDWTELWEIRRSQIMEYGIPADAIVLPAFPKREALVEAEDDPYGELDLQHLEQVYLSGAGGFWLARWENQPAGHIGAQDVGNTAIELRRMYVVSAYRRRGIGAALVQTLLAHCQTQCMQVVELWTEADGVGQKLYTTLGFDMVPTPGAEFERSLRPWDFVPGPTEIRMRLELR